MEVVAMDKLVEKGEVGPRLAQAIAEAIDIAIKAANLVTVPMMDARFAQQDAKMEARFGALEKSLETTKVWATLLYAGLLVIFFGALTADHRWLSNRQDQFMAQMQARFAAEEARTDRLIAEDRARTDRLVAEQQAHADQAEARMDAKLDQLRSLIINGLRK